MKWLLRMLRPFYGLGETYIMKCDVVVPLGYGLDSKDQLPSAEHTVLDVTAHLAKAWNARVAFVGSNYFFLDSDKHENQLKVQALKEKGVSSDPIIGEGISNSVTEARQIKKALEKAGAPHGNIVVVLDWPHARSAYIIWNKTFPNSRITIVSVEGKWTSSNRAFLQKSNFWWIVACILREIALRVRGLDWVASVQHRVAKRK